MSEYHQKEIILQDNLAKFNKIIKNIFKQTIMNPEAPELSLGQCIITTFNQIEIAAEGWINNSIN